MASPTFGVVAEDETDFRAARVLIQRLGGNKLSVIRRVTNGCSLLDAKLHIWLAQLAREGCSALIVLRDLDRNTLHALNDEAALRRRLESAPVPAGTRRLICIPVEELEAWFWSDPNVIQRVGRGKGKAHPSPHLIRAPKEALTRLSQQANGRPLYNTNQNESLAALLNLELCAERCASFREFRDFVLAQVRTVRK